MPRSPLPPVPEQAPLYHESFDEDYFSGQTNAELVIPGFGMLDESWSGYALDRTGATVVPFTIPALDPTGHTNLSSDTVGAMRFWFEPAWSSQSQPNGTGPGTNVVLVEFDAVSGGNAAFAWSLQLSPDGNTLELLAQTGSGFDQVLLAQIGWQTNESHCVALDFSPNGSMLYVDGQAVGQGPGLPAVPPSVGQLTIGSTIAGANPAGGDLEEVYSFDRWLTDSDVAAYYWLTFGQAAKGPISWQESEGWLQQGGGIQADTIHSPGNVYDPNNDSPCSTGGPFYITNLVATPQTNGTTTVSFDIQGGTNGVFYDIFASPNLNNNLANYQWTWIGQGLTCNGYTFTGQPAGQAFYILELPAETMTVAFGENYSGQCNVPLGLSNAVAVAAGGYFSLALRNNGRVIGWGDNTYEQTNIPLGLSNVVGITAGLYHGVALLANGAVTNWGSYYDVSYYSVTNYSVGTPPPLSNVLAVAAAADHDVALLSNGTVVTWGLTNSAGNYVPTNVVGVKAQVSGH